MVNITHKQLMMNYIQGFSLTWIYDEMKSLGESSQRLFRIVETSPNGFDIAFIYFVSFFNTIYLFVSCLHLNRVEYFAQAKFFINLLCYQIPLKFDQIVAGSSIIQINGNFELLHATNKL